MPATPRRIEFDDKDLEVREPMEYSYSDLNVPDDYEALLVDVADYDKTAEGKTKGWVWKFEIFGLPFNIFTAFSVKWRIAQIFQAFKPDTLEVGIVDVDPNQFIGQTCGARVDWQKDPDTLGEGEANYREIKYVFSLAELPEEEPEVL